jgi:hypothetical protein
VFTSWQGGVNEELTTCFETWRPADGEPSEGSRGDLWNYPQALATGDLTIPACYTDNDASLTPPGSTCKTYEGIDRDVMATIHH